MKFSLLVFIMILGSNFAFSQDNNLFNIDFNVISKQEKTIGFKSVDVSLNIPTKLKKGHLINSLLYSNYAIDYASNELINTESLTDFKSVGYSLKYENILNSNWSYGLQFSPTISSNFKSKLTFSAIIFNGEIIVTRKINESKFQVGLLNNSNLGFKNPVPIIAFSSNLNDKIHYTLGFPQTKIEYKINSTNSANLYIKPKGFYANLSDKISLNTLEEAEKALFQSVITGLNYTHKIDDFWKISLDTGYQLKSDYNLLKNNKNVYKFSTKNKLYVGLNLKFDLLNKKN